MNPPLISIVLPVFNGEAYLDQAIRSCIEQTYPNLELLIINDASTDNSLEIAQKWAEDDRRIRIITNEKNLQLPTALNIGHTKAKGDYITWTSDDNLFNKDALSSLYHSLTKEECDVIYSEYLHTNDEGVVSGQSHLKDIEYIFLFYGVIGACFLYKREVFDRNGGYDEKLFMVEDYDFWLRALKHSKFFKIDNPGIYKYRYHTNSLTIKRLSEKDSNELLSKNLVQLYRKFSSGLSYEQNLSLFFLAKYQKQHKADLMPLEKWFFNSLRESTEPCYSISFVKLKRIIINNLIEDIFREEEYQNLMVLLRLHLRAGKELLRLPVERYLALVKKCVF